MASCSCHYRFPLIGKPSDISSQNLSPHLPCQGLGTLFNSAFLSPFPFVAPFQPCFLLGTPRGWLPYLTLWVSPETPTSTLFSPRTLGGGHLGTIEKYWFSLRVSAFKLECFFWREHGSVIDVLVAQHLSFPSETGTIFKRFSLFFIIFSIIVKQKF